MQRSTRSLLGAFDGVQRTVCGAAVATDGPAVAASAKPTVVTRCTHSQVVETAEAGASTDALRLGRAFAARARPADADAAVVAILAGLADIVAAVRCRPARVDTHCADEGDTAAQRKQRSMRLPPRFVGGGGAA